MHVDGCPMRQVQLLFGVLHSIFRISFSPQSSKKLFTRKQYITNIWVNSKTQTISQFSNRNWEPSRRHWDREEALAKIDWRS